MNGLPRRINHSRTEKNGKESKQQDSLLEEEDVFLALVRPPASLSPQAVSAPAPGEVFLLPSHPRALGW